MQLSSAVNESSHAEVKSIAAIRLARVELARCNIDAASTALANVRAEGFAGIKGELQGDIYLAQGDRAAAREAYAAALAESDNSLNRVLQMKLDNLAAAE